VAWPSVFRLTSRLSEQEDTELMYQLKGGWMDRVAAKVTQEIRMLFEHHNTDTGASQ
jgi:hypothetical protein